MLAAAADSDALALELADIELSPEAPPLALTSADGARAAYLREQLRGAADELVARALGEVQP